MLIDGAGKGYTDLENERAGERGSGIMPRIRI